MADGPWLRNPFIGSVPVAHRSPFVGHQRDQCTRDDQRIAAIDYLSRLTRHRAFTERRRKGGSITSPSLPRRIPPVVVAFPTVAGAEPAERDTAPVAARASQTVTPT
jgi:hypothetical protein